MDNTFQINSNLFVDASFRDFIVSTECRVSAVIRSFETLKDVNYIGVTDKIDTISYLPDSKLEYVYANKIDPYSSGIGRTYLKVGRLVGKLLPKRLIDEYLSSSDIEEFVNIYKSFFDVSNRRLEVVDGEKLRKYYLANNYYRLERGTLWKSCMRYSDRQRFLDIYVQNPEKVKMLVMLSVQDGVERVRGRALLWEAEDMNGNKIKVMDRIYTIFDSDILVFKKWARESGYITKAYQNAKTQNIYDINGEDTLNLKVTLDRHLLGTYPYLDSFQFYNMDTGTFYNNTRSDYEYTLIQSDGNPYPHEDDHDDHDDGEYDFDYDESNDRW